ncbi:MAG: hypothetical protein IT464_12820 [Planctomycetes bacterium]|nr:hypothetical protein [Planctomycetota bacterium]
MAQYTYTIKDRADGGLDVLLEGDGQKGRATPAGVLAVAIDNLIKSMLGDKFEIEDD